MEFEIGDDPQGMPDVHEANRTGGVNTRPVFLFRGGPEDPLEAEDTEGQRDRHTHQMA